jgi:hypothetical protein
MGNGRIVKSAEHVRHRIYLAQVAKVGGLLQRLLPDSSQINVFDGSMSQFLGIEEGGEPVEAIVGYLRNPNVSFTWIGERVL